MTKKLHILFLCSWYHSKVFPTNGDFIQRHAEAVSLLHKVSVLHIVSDSTISTSKIEFKKTNNVNTYIGYVKSTSNSFLKFFRFLKMYFLLLKKIGKFDLIHLNVLYPFGWFALHQKLIYKTPYIISEHWTGYHLPQAKNISFIEKSFSKYISKNAAFICPVSNDLKLSMQKFGLTGNYNPIPNVVDTDLFKPAMLNKEDEYSIVHISSLKNDHKNISGMLKAAKILESDLTNFTWTFIGGNGNEYKNEVLDLKFSSAKINFIDHLSQDELIPFLQKAKVFVLFSYYENLPCVILEAFSSGTPVISTNVGGISEYFPEEFGFFVPLNNSIELASKIKELYNQPINKSEEMHQYAKENFSKLVIAEKFTELYFKSIH